MLEPEETPEIPSTISINGVDYDPTELQSFIDKGKQTLDLEKQWDTPVDKVWPEYGKTREQVNTLSQENTTYKQKIAEYEAKQSAGTDTPQDLKQAREAARQLGITLNEDLEKTYIKREELDKYFSDFTEKQQATQRIIDNARSLEKEIDGSDGRPAFNAKVVLPYANAYGHGTDLKAAYEDMHKPQIEAWKKQQVDSNKPKGLKTLGTGGNKEPRETKVTDDNVTDLLSEAFYGGNN